MTSWHYISENGSLLQAQHEYDAGYDLRSSSNYELAPMQRQLVQTPWRVALPNDSVGLVVPRSGLAFKHGITVLNAPGIIDAGYRGPLAVLLINLGGSVFTIHPGDRIAQLVVAKLHDAKPALVADLDIGTDRGDGGFGSTGIN